MNSSWRVRSRRPGRCQRRAPAASRTRLNDLLGGPERDRAPGQDFLELAERDVRAPEGNRADDRGEHVRRSRHTSAPRRLRRARAPPPRPRGPRRLLDRVRPVSRSEDGETPPRRSAQTAPPPTPLNRATICGIAVIFTWARRRHADHHPRAPRPGRSAPSCPRSGSAASAITAIAIPTAAMRLPRTAVVGPARPRSPWMNRANARMYRT